MAEGPSLCQHDHESVTHKNSMIVEPVMTRPSLDSGTAGGRDGPSLSFMKWSFSAPSVLPQRTNRQNRTDRRHRRRRGQTTSKRPTPAPPRPSLSYSNTHSRRLAKSRCGPSGAPNKSLLSPLVCRYKRNTSSPRIVETIEGIVPTVRDDVQIGQSWYR